MIENTSDLPEEIGNVFLPPFDYRSIDPLAKITQKLDVYGQRAISITGESRFSLQIELFFRFKTVEANFLDFLKLKILSHF